MGRNPAGFFDPGGARPAPGRRPRGGLRGAEGRPLVALLHYATHPTLMAHENRLITPDYPGWPGARWRPSRGRPASSCRGAPATSARRGGITEGHTGDTSYLPPGGEDPGGRGGAGLSDPGDAPLRGHLRGRCWSPGPPWGCTATSRRRSRTATLRVATATATLPVRPFPTREEGEARAAGAREVLATLRREGAPAQAVAEATWRAKRIAQQAGPLPPDRRAARRWRWSCRRSGIGPAALLGAPMEVFNALGAAVVGGLALPLDGRLRLQQRLDRLPADGGGVRGRGLRGGDGQPLRPGGRGALRRRRRRDCCWRLR